MNKTQWTFLILAGATCLVIFNVIGSRVDSNGVLQEPFILLPIGWLLLAIGAMGLLAQMIYRHFFKQKANNSAS